MFLAALGTQAPSSTFSPTDRGQAKPAGRRPSDEIKRILVAELTAQIKPDSWVNGDLQFRML